MPPPKVSFISSTSSKAKLPIKKPKFKNDPKLTSKINLEQAIFKRDLRAEDIHEGHQRLH